MVKRVCAVRRTETYSAVVSIHKFGLQCVSFKISFYSSVQPSSVILISFFPLFCIKFASHWSLLNNVWFLCLYCSLAIPNFLVSKGLVKLHCNLTSLLILGKELRLHTNTGSKKELRTQSGLNDLCAFKAFE